MKNKKKLIIPAIILSPLIIYGLYLLLKNLRNISPGDILAFMPENKFFALGIILLLYGLKSVSVVFPIAVINMAVGLMYPLKYSFLINLTGSVIALTVPYTLGVICKESWAEKLGNKYKSINKIEEYRCENQMLFTYLTRAVGFLPCDILSWYMGNMRMNFLQYLAGSLMGMAPALILNTIFGEKLNDGFTIDIVIVAGLLFVTSFVISYFSNKAMKKLKK